MLEEQLIKDIIRAFGACFDAEIAEGDVTLQPTRKDFEGSHTLVCFPFSRISKKGPEQTAEQLGEWLAANSPLVRDFNVVKGFLNLSLHDSAWISVIGSIHANAQYGFSTARGEEVMIEYSSPNTNKPLHLGHLRNNFLGWSVAEILKANGYTVHKVQIINDRGIHICKSMVAWKRFGEGATPDSTGKKGDKLVGDYYVKFDKEYKKEIASLIDQGKSQEEAEKSAPIMLEAQDMLRKWEQKDPEVYALWEQMNQWVYTGFNATYKRMGVDFDKLYYESETFLLGKEEVLKGLEQGIFYQKEDNSVWVDLSEDGLDQKLLLRADGTSVYMTQDIGTAILRYREFPDIIRQIYTVGNEQEYHFKVLFLILDKLGYSWAKECYHLSYGMVDLPTGKMKSREGTVVDADDLMEEMVETAGQHTQELGKIEGFTNAQARELYETLGLGALKYFLLKVDPRKRMLFDPNESIQFQGNTAPFIQYTHARICAILRKAEQLEIGFDNIDSDTSLLEVETYLIQLVSQYPIKVSEAGENYAPDIIANYVYDLAKEYNRFYQEIPIFAEEDTNKLKIRVLISSEIARVIRLGMSLLGIHVPERM
ncbi:arginine--tRNA ligase [Fulvivirga sedimenti]|uniref:Arginine--tRNA ligase n=1 Tax=Fulvivirga sedimenti TaxID=2879465 RepID=A0A9X1HWH4_9BACT|nr:arginine--tRNA ligase [Fulvivirga sedimenti]MCA6075297.1 arginine--tRNA ligase [Fulvivirga sedimenti]MCA6076474.1 arginine--tRNA ligase [Fulvivirga sedimenti]MCA6077602.1 arginine--tRNA ligase [Fulvivirga sedimenti]